MYHVGTGMLRKLLIASTIEPQEDVMRSSKESVIKELLECCFHRQSTGISITMSPQVVSQVFSRCLNTGIQIFGVEV